MTSPSLSAAPSQSFLWRILSWTHLLLFSLGLSLLLLVVISVIGSQSGLQGGRNHRVCGQGRGENQGSDWCRGTAVRATARTSLRSTRDSDLSEMRAVVGILVKTRRPHGQAAAGHVTCYCAWVLWSYHLTHSASVYACAMLGNNSAYPLGLCEAECHCVCKSPA